MPLDETLRYVPFVLSLLLLLTAISLWPRTLKKQIARSTEELHRKIAEHRAAQDELQSTNALLQTPQEELRALASELALAEEGERRRIATGLHDQIGQALVACQLRIGKLRALAPPPGIAGGLDDIEKLLDDAVRETRSLTFELSSSLLYELGIEDALADLCEQMEARYGVRFHLEEDQERKPLNDQTGVVLFQAVRELLFNVAKHARASEATVTVRKVGDAVEVEVRDDGVGFETGGAGEGFSRSGGFGLFNIQERLKHVNGRLVVESKPGAGARVAVSVPLACEEGVS